jgi:hypothetical protein
MKPEGWSRGLKCILIALLVYFFSSNDTKVTFTFALPLPIPKNEMAAVAVVVFPVLMMYQIYRRT